MTDQPPSRPSFDWPQEHTGLKRDMSRFRTELNRLLAVRGSAARLRQATSALRERWERLVVRLEGRWARGGDAWERQSEEIERLRAERHLHRAVLALEVCLDSASGVDECINETLRTIAGVVATDGAVIHIHEIGGRSTRVTTARRGKRPWPPSADLELADFLLAGAEEGRRVIIEGRPVGGGQREQNRMAHWLSVGIVHRGSHYGSAVLGRRSSEEPFRDDEAEALEEILGRLGRSLSLRAGAGVRPVLGAGDKPEGFVHLWGESPSFRRALALAARLAVTDSPVLIEGEIGTGRLTLARAIHERSPRAGKPFVVSRGSDLPQDVVGRQLFGFHEHQADATAANRPGDLELAEGGTLYIEELSVLDSVLQLALVRLLNEGTFERVDDRESRRADVRLVLATTMPLEEAVAQGRIREELYYLLTAARISLPPLSARGGDIVELARRFAIDAGTKAGKTINGIDHEAARQLMSLPFPGNVRQLGQMIERAVYLSSGPLIGVADLPEEGVGPLSAVTMDVSGWLESSTQAVRNAVDAGQSGNYTAYRRARGAAGRAINAAFVAAVYKAVGEQPARAARHVGIHRAQWWRLLRDSGEPSPPSVHDPAKNTQPDDK